jgi:predicted PurR-regulated permease PerM
LHFFVSARPPVWSCTVAADRANEGTAKTLTTMSARDEEGLVSHERLRLWVLGAVTVIFIILCVVLAIPFLPAITWGIALAIIAWPLHAKVTRHISNHTVAASISLSAVVLAILLPGLFIAYQIVNEAASAADRVQAEQAEGKLREGLRKVPGMEGVVAWMDRANFDPDREVRKFITSFTQRDVAGLLQGSVMAIIQFALALFILFYLLHDRPTVMQGVRGMMPLSRRETDRVFKRIADSVHATVYGQVVTGIINGVGGGLMFWLVGLPSPILWGVVMAVLSILPVLGTFVVWAPAAIYLLLISQPLSALALVTWGLLSAIITDNILYTRLVGTRMRLHAVPTLLALLGGLAVFGFSGVIIGPAIAAATMALLEVWGRRSGEEASDAIVKRLEQASEEADEAVAKADEKAEKESVATEMTEKMEKAAATAADENTVGNETGSPEQLDRRRAKPR